MLALQLLVDQMEFKLTEAAIWCCMTNDFVEAGLLLYGAAEFRFVGKYASERCCWCRVVFMQITRQRMKM